MTDASTKRFGRRGWCSPGKLPKGPNGRACCRECSKEVPERRRSFCSEACVTTWKLRTDPQAQTRFLLKRDQGICQLCRLDCLALLAELKTLRLEARKERWGYAGTVQFEGALGSDQHLDRFTARLTALSVPLHLRGLDRRLWEADHTVPVVEGGGDCGPENLRTLCWACHRAVTAELKKRMAAKRKLLAVGGCLG